MTPAKPTFLAATAQATASALNLDPQHVGAGIAKGVESLVVTSGAVAAALVLGAAAAHIDSPQAFEGFVAQNWWTAFISVIAALVRSRQGYRASLAASAALPAEAQP